VGQHWKVEGVLAPRLGGGVFAAFHAVSGVRAAITFFPPVSAREAVITERIGRELSALRLLDKNRGILTLIEEGSESDGARFLVHELGQLRLLQDLLDEWQKPDRGLLDPPVAAQVVRPLLSALSTAHRIGAAHASLTPLDIYVGIEGEPAEGITRVAEARLHGMLTHPMGPELRQAVAADLRAIGATLFELLVGRKPPDSIEALRALPLPKVMLSPVGKVAMRALGGSEQPTYLGAEEMLRALVTTIPTVLAPSHSEKEPPTRIDPDVTKRAQQQSKPSDHVNTKPTVPIEIIQPPNWAVPSQPGLPLPAAMAPLRSGLTAELHQVSIHDLMKEQELMAKAASVETVAKSSHNRSSVTDLPILPLQPEPLAPSPSPVAPMVAARPEGVFQGISFGQEPTIPAVVNASLLAVSAEGLPRVSVSADASVVRPSSVSQPDKAGSSGSVTVSISGAVPRPLGATGPIVIPPQPSGPTSLSPNKPPSVSASGAAFQPVQLGGSPARSMSRPPSVAAPAVGIEYEPTPASGQAPVNPEEPTEPAPAIKVSRSALPKVTESADSVPPAPVAHAPVPAGRELPPWVWAAILGVVCLLALLAGLFGR
jgi:serine/threonine protein kinase